ncbi:MAG: hypothetical protein IPN05_09590 [Sulfuritalea sp.]|nr:hypothetical protein [Sulfuritalea sp.]
MSAWFEDYWIARGRQRVSGIACDPGPCAAGRAAAAERMRSTTQPCGRRDALGAAAAGLTANRDYLAEGTDSRTRPCWPTPKKTTRARPHSLPLVLFHEDMHAEAAIDLAQALDIPLPAGLCRTVGNAARTAPCTSRRSHGPSATSTGGFAFDNELQAHEVSVGNFEIDSEAVSWARYLPCLEATGAAPPRYLRKAGGGWQYRALGEWLALDLDAPA